MIKNTVIDRCLKSDFKVFEQISEKCFILHWGKQDEVERIYEINEETGEPYFTGETKETDWCTYESCTFKGSLNPYLLLNDLLSSATRRANLDEIHEIFVGLNLDNNSMTIWMTEALNKEIVFYDSSSEVNSFTINDIPTWLDKATRVGLKLRFEAEIQSGKTETTLWNGSIPITLPLNDAMNMLYAIEIYASACYDITQSHLSQVGKLTDVESIKSYDYKSDYPSKLSF